VTQPVFDIHPDYRELKRPHVAEWFGHRVFPVVSGSASAMTDQKRKRCPFLSKAFRRDRFCIKLHKDGPSRVGNSEGVCSISSMSNGPRQDWIVCPVRALDDDLLEDVVRRLYGVSPHETVELTPASALGDGQLAQRLVEAVHAGGTRGRSQGVSASHEMIMRRY